MFIVLARRKESYVQRQVQIYKSYIRLVSRVSNLIYSKGTIMSHPPHALESRVYQYGVKMQFQHLTGVWHGDQVTGFGCNGTFEAEQLVLVVEDELGRVRPWLAE